MHCSLAELSLRSECGEEGSLCGLAALYQALLSTLLTPSQLRLQALNTQLMFP